MKIEIYVIIYLCVLAASCSCFQKYIHTITAKVNELFGKQLCKDDNTPPVWEINPDGPPSVVSQCYNTDDKFCMFGINWRNISFKVVNNWWTIYMLYAISSLLPFIVYWRIQHNIRKRLHEWRKLIKKQKPIIRSRRITLPDLTLARHARRETLAETTQKLSNNSRNLSQSSISQLRSTKNTLIEKNDDLGDIKRVRIIRRRH